MNNKTVYLLDVKNITIRINRPINVFKERMKIINEI